MKKTITSKLFWLLKLCIFNILAAVSLLAHAEYYLVYSAPEYSNVCDNCQGRPHKYRVKAHHLAARKPHKVHAHHYYHRRSGLYVYNARPSCPCPDYCEYRVRSQAGDYVVFSKRAVAGMDKYEKIERSYNPDMSTADDNGADLEVN